MKKILIPALAAVLCLGVAPATANAKTSIQWHHCQLGSDDKEGQELDEAGAECGELAVPLDYSRPDGRKITVAFSRLKATGNRIGAMVLNDGGPGGPGLGMPLRLRAAMKDAGGRYDLIGMDPRFVGRSTPLDCNWPISSWIWSAGADRASFDRGVALQKDLAARCTATQADLLPYATTRNTARDIDLLRAALGEEKVSYLGYSYGSYLGAVYMQLFPQRLDRVVLDGPADPDVFGPHLLRDSAAVNETALKAWAGWAAARDRTYHLGRTTSAVLEKVQRIYQVAAQRPLSVGAHKLDDGTVPGLLMSSLADDRDPARARFTTIIQTLLAATYGPTEPDAALGELLDFLLTGKMSTAGSSQVAIVCGDRAARRDVESYWRDIQTHRASEPYFGALARNVSPCAFWPNEPQETPTQVGNAVPALLVAADGDPRTTYPMAKKLHAALTGSRMLTLRNAQTHGVFGEYGNECVDRQVIRYLNTGKLPNHDRSCTA